MSKKRNRKRKSAGQKAFVFDEGKGLSSEKQQYDTTSMINEVRSYVDTWRALPNPSQWQVTPETVRLLEHWRNSEARGIRQFFCQIEAVETAIWLTEVAPHSRNGQRVLAHLAAANKDANPELIRTALKLATGAGKTTVMAMLIAWQTVNAVRHQASKTFTRGFLVSAPGLTIKDRLRVLLINHAASTIGAELFLIGGIKGILLPILLAGCGGTLGPVLGSTLEGCPQLCERVVTRSQSASLISAMVRGT